MNQAVRPQIFLSVKDEDKREIVFIAKKLQDMKFSLKNETNFLKT